MNMPASSSAALPLARGLLRILVVANGLAGVMIVAMLFVLTNDRWFRMAFPVSPATDTHQLALALRAVAVLGLVTIPINHLVLKRLVAIVQTVREGDPFVAANAERLQTIARALLALQLLSLVIDAIGKTVPTAAHSAHLDAGVSINGWLAVLLTFLLARVFAAGTAMREDLEGTV